MKINLEELNLLPEKTKNISFFERIKDLDNNEEVTAQIQVIATDFGVNITGKVKTNIELQCDRCLALYNFPVDVNINEEFIKDSIVPDYKKDYELTEGHFVEELQGKNEIDLTEFLYQTIILELPNKKLCKEECQGSTELQEINNEDTIDERLEIFKTISENNFNNTDENNNRK